MADLIPVRRALISVSDKTGVVDFARALADRGVEIISTGGTARLLRESGVLATSVEAVTGFPEVMGGRVKTLHPAIHGGILALRDDRSHVEAMERHGIEPIDLVCVNLYPFERTVADPGVAFGEAVEQVDIGGPAMVRAAAKNSAHVVVATDPAQYGPILEDLAANGGSASLELRLSLMREAYERTAAYDGAIAEYLARRTRDDQAMPATIAPRRSKAADLRYGENPHQRAALYVDGAHTGPSAATAEQLHGKALSYNNINDASAALDLVLDLHAAMNRPAAAVIKHANPCGAAVADRALDAVDAALAGDPLAAFGGILASSAPIDDASAERLCAEGTFLEVVLAPSFDDAALERLRARWANVRLLAYGDPVPRGPAPEFRYFRGGALAQDADLGTAPLDEWDCAAGPDPGRDGLLDALVVWLVAKHLKSNAVAIGGRNERGAVMLFGGGAGQMDRLTASRIAVEKAGERAKGAIAASDAFFPFPDGPAALMDGGVSVIVQPGGSKRDRETLDLCAQRGVACVLTGRRHFRH